MGCNKNGSIKVKSFYVHESDTNQIIQNYLAREGGEIQNFRADISTAYGKWISETCRKLNIKVIESRPWNTVIDRVTESLL